MQKTTQILPPVVDRDYRLSNFWLAKEVNKELKKKLLHQKGKNKSAQLSCVEVLHANVGFFLRAIEMHRKRNIGAECECIAKYIWSHF